MNAKVSLQHLSKKLLAKQWYVVTAESCTGGLVAKLITDQVGSGNWFERGWITYAEIAKQQMIGVDARTLKQHGAVSEQVAREMAEGALKNSHGHVSIAITGLAGPTSDDSGKPVGTVWFAWARKDLQTIAKVKHFSGDRESIREQAAEYALEELEKLI